MNAYEIYHKLKCIEGHLHTIKTKGDSIDALDDVTTSQYSIQDTMADIIEDLLVLISSKCDDPFVQLKGIVTDKVYATYIPQEDKTVVWHDVYVNDECILSQLTGWYCGEPCDSYTLDFDKSNNTAYLYDTTNVISKG